MDFEGFLFYYKNRKNWPGPLGKWMDHIIYHKILQFMLKTKNIRIMLEKKDYEMIFRSFDTEFYCGSFLFFIYFHLSFLYFCIFMVYAKTKNIRIMLDKKRL